MLEYFYYTDFQRSEHVAFKIQTSDIQIIQAQRTSDTEDQCFSTENTQFNTKDELLLGFGNDT